MTFETLLGIDRDLLVAFAALRNPVFDVIFQIATELGHELFLILFAAIGYWFLDKDVFRRALFMLLFAAMANSVLKEFFALPRPTITATYAAEGYSFPSGHAQMAAAFWGWLAYEARHRVTLCRSLIVVSLLVALSRPYLGVHHFHDIAIGLGLGYAQIWGGALLLRHQDSALPSNPWPLAIIASLVMVIVGLGYFDHPDMQKLGVILASFYTGTHIGTLLEQRHLNFRLPVTFTERALTLVVGIIVLMLVWRGLKPGFAAIGFDGLYADLVRYTATAFWVATGMPWLMQRHIAKTA